MRIMRNLNCQTQSRSCALSPSKAFLGALSRIKTHISSKTEALFSSVPMEQRLMRRYLTAEK